MSSFINFKKKYKASAFRWHVVELYRLGLVSETQILAELKISRNSLRVWNRAYQRYRLRRYYPKPNYSRLKFPKLLMKKKTDEIALLKQQLVDTQKQLKQEKLKREALEIVINIADPKKVWSQAVNQLSLEHPLVSIQTLCGLFGKSRQAWYEKQKQNDKSTLQEAMLLAEVRRLRVDLPSVGVEILHHQLADFRVQQDIKLGRDKFAKLLIDNGLLVRRRTRRARTTWSDHPFRKYPNLTKEMKVATPNRLWVSDITYVPLQYGFAYLSLIIDAYSRKIVGWALHRSLQMDGPLMALKMALKENKVGQNLIHHSDRGVQYCCREYIGLLRRHKVIISMTEQGDPYENALAERVNRTIKQEMLLNRSFVTYEMAQQAVQRAIENYNRIRPHRSCAYHTPEQAHRMQGELVKKWRISKRKQDKMKPQIVN